MEQSKLQKVENMSANGRAVVECLTRDERAVGRASPASLCCVINPNSLLVQSRKTCPFITEKLLMGRKESNQNKQNVCQWLVLVR